MADREQSIKFRPLNETDFEVLWAAYLAKSFKMRRDMGKLEFLAWFNLLRSRYQEVLMVEMNQKPIALVCAFFDGWKYEPHVEFFSWAKKREMLESTTKFFKELCCMDTIGVVVVKCLKHSTTLFNHVKKRGFLDFVGVMPKGDYRGDEYIYSIDGNAKRPYGSRNPTANEWV